jgi:hypothetical protein
MLHISEGFERVIERMFPIVMKTGHIFLSPEYEVRWVWSELPIIGIRVPPRGILCYEV